MSTPEKQQQARKLCGLFSGTAWPHSGSRYTSNCSVPRHRELFTLNRQQGLSYASIAAKLNISVECVENQMTYALKFLKLYFWAHNMLLALALLCLVR